MTDGAETYGGYFRFFGLNTQRRLNLFTWNAKALWIFAWNGLADDYLCFGETAWGDQYAYRISDLKSNLGAEIYHLDAFDMTAEKICNSFTEYLAGAGLRNAFEPRDQVTVQVRNRLGDLKLGEHVVYMPSLLIAGPEDPERAMKAEAVAAMVINGDLFTQLGNLETSRLLKRLDTYTDSNGRTRLKAVWADN